MRRTLSVVVMIAALGWGRTGTPTRYPADSASNGRATHALPLPHVYLDGHEERDHTDGCCCEHEESRHPQVAAPAAGQPLIGVSSMGLVDPLAAGETTA